MKLTKILWDLYGATISALVTITLFMGPLIVGILYTLFPADLVDSLVIEDRPPVYFDGAFVLSDKEEEGELDGQAEAAPDPVDEPSDDGSGGDPDGNAKANEATTDKNPGADSIADPRKSTSARGVSAGDKVGTGKAVKGDGAPGRKQKKSRRQCPKSYDGIQRRADGVIELDKSIVSYYTANLKRFNSLGWSKNNKGGKGWVISGFNCFGPVWHGGIRRGDIILAVNGKKTNNMLQILRLYPKVRNQRKFEVDVLRRGRKLTLRYEIVKP